MSDQVVKTVTTPMRFRRVQSRRLDATKLVRHRFELSEIIKACAIVGSAAQGRA